MLTRSGKILEVCGQEGKYPNSWVELWLFQTTMFSFMMKKSMLENDTTVDIMVPKKWHHLCVAVNGTSLVISGVMVS